MISKSIICFLSVLSVPGLAAEGRVAPLPRKDGAARLPRSLPLPPPLTQGFIWCPVSSRSSGDLREMNSKESEKFDIGVTACMGLEIFPHTRFKSRNATTF